MVLTWADVSPIAGQCPLVSRSCWSWPKVAQGSVPSLPLQNGSAPHFAKVVFATSSNAVSTVRSLRRTQLQAVKRNEC